MFIVATQLHTASSQLTNPLSSLNDCKTTSESPSDKQNKTRENHQMILRDEREKRTQTAARAANKMQVESRQSAYVCTQTQGSIEITQIIDHYPFKSYEK